MMKLSYLLLVLVAVFFSCSSPKETSQSTITNPGNEPQWWKEAVIYQIYPRSFKDSDGDGVGDLRGIINKLDYIKSLGVNMVWINPIYASPNADNGYDISDYRAIQPEFGTNEDFDELLKGLHDRDIKFVMDLVVNHSSDEHEWFKQSRSSRDNPYRDYYHWWPAEKGKPNYRWSFFDPKGEAWKYNSLTDAYYLHYFAQKQPDLNWENPKVRQEVYDIMKYWADKGVDGFRLDAFQFISKDLDFPPLPEGYEKEVIKYYGMGPNIHPYIKEMYDQVLSKYDVFAVSEGAGSSFEDAHALVDKDRNELQMAYHFEAGDMVRDLSGYTLETFKEIHSRWDSAFAEKGWLSVFLANHDKARMVNRFGNPSPQFRAPSTKMLNTFILSMRGTPYCYYGDELGMTNINFDSIEQYQDIAAINGYEKVKSEGGDLDQYMAELKFLSRDNGRTPMQWDDTENAGFTTGNPWLPVNSNYREINVEVQQNESNSCLSHFKEMIDLRLKTPALIYGAYEMVEPNHETVYAYTRSYNDQQYLVVLNFSDQTSSIDLSNFDLSDVSINNYQVLNKEGSTLNLEPYQAVIFKTK
ncbi:MAG: alpha-glucosidase [Flammeovirgaceae bacterium]|nr:alpha-glucosidase [Flammeovirgaceae bacterium]MBE63891.1 alpha-glucosidase [Flammeovirgaceae bacterium]